LLDIEPIYPHEGELTSSNRLLERVCRDYPKAFEAVTGDALYLNGTTFDLLASHGKYGAAALKDERRYLYEEAISLLGINTWNADHVYRHSQNAIRAFILFLFIVLNIFNIFFSRNIKDRRISSRSFLIELVKAEFLLAKWLNPIPL